MLKDFGLDWEGDVVAAINDDDDEVVDAESLWQSSRDICNFRPLKGNNKRLKFDNDDVFSRGEFLHECFSFVSFCSKGREKKKEALLAYVFLSAARKTPVLSAGVGQ